MTTKHKIQPVKEMKEEKLTDTQIDQISETLSESVSEKSKKMRKMMSDINKEEDKPFPTNVLNKPELLEGKAKIKVDENTGDHVILGPSDKEADYDMDSIEDIQINRDDANKTLLDMGLSDEDALVFAKILEKYVKGEKIDYLKELPVSIKTMLTELCGSTDIREINKTAKLLMDQFCNEVKVDKAYIDLRTTIKNTLDEIPKIEALYTDYEKNKMETVLLAEADKLEEKGEKVKADQLRDISHNYTDSYTMIQLNNALTTGKVRRLDKKVKRIDRLMDEFNYKYKDSKFEINNIRLIIPVLARHIGCTVMDVNLFVALICEYTKNFEPDKNIGEHAFMYYTIKNILSLDYVGEKFDFQNNLIKNIKNTIKLIHEKGMKVNG